MTALDPIWVLDMWVAFGHDSQAFDAEVQTKGVPQVWAELCEEARSSCPACRDRKAGHPGYDAEDHTCLSPDQSPEEFVRSIDDAYDCSARTRDGVHGCRCCGLRFVEANGYCEPCDTRGHS